MADNYNRSPYSGSAVIITGSATADAEVDTFVLDEDWRIATWWAVKHSAVGAAGDTLTLKVGANTIGAIDLNGTADKAMNTGTIDDAYWDLSDGDSVTVTAAEASSVDSTYFIQLVRR